MFKKPLLNCMFCVTLLTSSAAFADSGGYLGLRVGTEMDERFVGAGNVETDTPFGFYGGWNFSDHWGVEFSYADLGETSDFGIADGGFTVDGHLSTGGMSYRHAIGDRFDLFGSVGLFDLSEDGAEGTIAGPRPIDLDDDGLYAEVGGRFHFNDRFALRASYQWFNFGNVITNGSEGTAWLGVEFGFL